MRDQERSEVSSSVSSREDEVTMIEDRERGSSTESNSNSSLPPQRSGSQEAIAIMDKIINETKSTPTNSGKNFRKIKMLNNQEGYDVLADLNTSKCDITYGQLFNLAPKIRSQVSQGLKLEKLDSSKPNIVGAVENIQNSMVCVNNIDHTYVSKSTKINDD